MKRNLLTLVAAGAIALSGFAFAQAPDKGGFGGRGWRGRGNHLDRMTQMLNLTPDQAQVPQIMTGLLNFARCMRSHGIPNWPDPTTDRNGQPVFDIPGINPDSPRVSNTADECTHLLVQSTTGPTTIQLCNGIGEDGGCGGYGDPPR